MDVLRNEHADTPLQFHVAFPPDTETPGFEKENVQQKTACPRIKKSFGASSLFLN